MSKLNFSQRRIRSYYFQGAIAMLVPTRELTLSIARNLWKTATRKVLECHKTVGN